MTLQTDAEYARLSTEFRRQGETAVRLIRRIVSEAAWPGIAVLVAHGVFGELLGHEPYVDPAMHLLGGVAAAFFFVRMPRLVPRYFGEPTSAVLYMLGFGLTAAVAVLWELGEFLSDVLVGTHIQRSVGNTMRDLFNGLLGAGLFIAGDTIVRRTMTPKSQLQRAAERA